MSKYQKRYPATLPPVDVVNEVIAAESQRRLINHAWRSDLAATCEALVQRLAQHDTKRARLALALLAGAADDTSRRMAVRLVAQWYPDDVAAVTA
jgi:GH35 family endo-1,4-beta-xylanase